MVMCLGRGANLRMVQLMPLPLIVSCSRIQTGFTFLVLAHMGIPGQRAVKRVLVLLLYVCMYELQEALTPSPSPRKITHRGTNLHK